MGGKEESGQYYYCFAARTRYSMKLSIFFIVCFILFACTKKQQRPTPGSNLYNARGIVVVIGAAQRAARTRNARMGMIKRARGIEEAEQQVLYSSTIVCTMQCARRGKVHPPPIARTRHVACSRSYCSTGSARLPRATSEPSRPGREGEEVGVEPALPVSASSKRQRSSIARKKKRNRI